MRISALTAILMASPVLHGCSTDPDPPIGLEEALAIGIAHSMEAQGGLSLPELYVSNGVLKHAPADPFGWIATHPDSCEVRSFGPAELERFRELGIETCDLDAAAEEVWCPGLGEPDRRKFIVFGGKPALKLEGEGWWVPVVLLHFSREPTPMHWVSALLIDLEEAPEGSGNWIGGDHRLWFAEN